MKDYVVVREKSKADLERRVNWWLEKGYECQGGVSIAVDSTIIYVQAMVQK